MSKPGACLCQQLQDCSIRVRFDRVTNQVIEWRERGIEPCVVDRELFQRCKHKVGAPNFLRHARKIDIFAVKLAVTITKKMHRRM